MTGSARERGAATAEHAAPDSPATASALEGDLARFGVAEVLHWLRWGQVTGRAEFACPAERITLRLDGGRLLQADASGRSVRIGDVLAHRGEVTAAQLEAATVEQRRRGGRLGERLIAGGACAPSSVRGALEACTRRIVTRLLLWREGRFRFVPEAPVRPGAVPFEMDLEQLVLDGLRLADAAAAG